MSTVMYCNCGWWGLGTGDSDDTCPMCGGFLSVDKGGPFDERKESKSVTKRRRIQDQARKRKESEGNLPDRKA